MNNETPEANAMPPHAVLVQMTFGSILSQALSVAAKLRVADLLAEGPKTAEEIAAKTGAHAPSVFRLLRTLSQNGVLVRDSESRFSNTEISELLRSDHPRSFRAIVHMMGDTEHWMALGNMEHSVMTGECGFDNAFGKSLFEHLAEHPETASVFDDAMTNMSNSIGRGAVTSYDYSEVGSVADIGGGHGLLLSIVLEANPHLKGYLFDQPHVVEGARHPNALGVADRTEIVAGSFFEDIPVDADLYMMKHIIHDWDDEESVAILSNIAKSAKPGARLLLVETVVEDKDVPSLSGIMDLNMLAMTPGRERTEAEYKDLMERSGFRFVQVHDTGSPMNLVEGERV